MAMTKEDNAKIESAQKKWAEANAKGDEAGKSAAHAEAEAVRAGYGYSGGNDGSERIQIYGGESSKNNTNSSSTYNDDVKRLSELQKQQAVQSYKNTRDKIISQLDKQKTEIAPAYQNQRNVASSNSQLGAKNFAEYLANRGLTRSGASAQGEINRQSSLQNTLGNIGVAETKAYNDIETAKTDAETDYLNNIASAGAQIDADYFAKVLEKNEQERQKIEALQDKTLYQYANDYQARINELISKGYPSNSQEIIKLQALRGEKIANQQSNLANNALTYLQMGYSSNQIANALQIPIQDVEAIAQYYKQLKNNELAISNANVTGTNLENQYLTKQIANYGTSKSGGSNNSNSNKVPYSTHQEIIERNFDTSTARGKQQIYDYLETENKNGRLSDKDAQTLINYYNLNSNSQDNNILSAIKNLFG